jgi:hypothetical protein
VPDRDSTCELFYGYPDWVIAEWCCVSLNTARQWKSGARAPGPAATKLFTLYRDGRILDDAWQGWAVHRGKLCDPEGHETTQAQLRAYPFIWQLAHEYGRQNPAAKDELTRLIAWQLGRAAPSHGQPNGQPGLGQDAAPSATAAPLAKPSGKAVAATARGSRRPLGTLRQRGPKGRPSQLHGTKLP